MDGKSGIGLTDWYGRPAVSLNAVDVHEFRTSFKTWCQELTEIEQRLQAIENA